jgi:gas vesicle protein
MAKSGKILAALLVGVAAGAALGILFAPDRGSETRKKFTGKASDLGDQIRNKFNKGKEVVDNLKERVKNSSDDYTSRAGSN